MDVFLRILKRDSIWIDGFSKTAETSKAQRKETEKKKVLVKRGRSSNRNIKIRHEKRLGLANWGREGMETDFHNTLSQRGVCDRIDIWIVRFWTTGNA